MRNIMWFFKALFDCEKIDGRSKNMTFMVWGTGQWGSNFTKMLKDMLIEPVVYLDVDIEKQRRKFNNKPVMEPTYGLEKFPNKDIVVAMNNNIALPIIESLKKRNRRAMTVFEFIIDCMTAPISMLEIGPWNNPFLKGNYVKYLDVLNEDGLKNRANEFNLSLSNIPKHIDFVSPNGSMDDVQEKFDVVYSSHVIEHQVDLVRHMQEVERHLKNKGVYILVIPDKRYCFNFFDPETNLEDVLSAYYEGRRRHSLAALLRSLIGTHNDVIRHWNKDHGRCGKYTIRNIKNILEKYNKSLDGEYVDVHEWYFTPASFSRIINMLIELKLLSFSHMDISETLFNSNSFYVYLKK